MPRENSSHRWTSDLCEFIHQYIVEIFGCLIPGGAFILGFELFLRLNAAIVKSLLDVAAASAIASAVTASPANDQTVATKSIVYVHDNAAAVATESVSRVQNDIPDTAATTLAQVTDNISDIATKSFTHIHENVWIFLMMAYVVGVLFNRRSLQQPDSISQIIRSLDRAYKSTSVSLLVYFIVCGFGSIKKFIYEFNSHIRMQCDTCAQTCMQEKVEDSSSPRNRSALYAVLHDRVPLKELSATKRLEMDIAGGRLDIMKCVLRFLRQEIAKYAIFFFFALLLIGGTVLAEHLWEESWPYALILMMGVCSGMICISERLRKPYFATKDKVQWRDCPHKKQFSTDPQKAYMGNQYEEYDAEACNRCTFLKSQVTCYPYEDFFDVYLTCRDCTWLAEYGWSRKVDQNGKRTDFRKQSNIRIIESMKRRLYKVDPSGTLSMRRQEAQIRLVGTLWHMSKFFITICWGILFSIVIYKISRDAYWTILKSLDIKNSLPFFNAGISGNWLRYFSRNFILFVAAFFVNYSIASFFHFLRLKEVHHILELFYLYVRNNKRDAQTTNNKEGSGDCNFHFTDTPENHTSCSSDTMLHESDFWRKHQERRRMNAEKPTETPPAPEGSR